MARVAEESSDGATENRMQLQLAENEQTGAVARDVPAPLPTPIERAASFVF